MAAIKVLLVGDGPFMDANPPQDGINFLKDSLGNYVQDTSDNTFTVSELIYLLTTSAPGISVDTAHRRNDPNATFPNFNFATTTELSNYDVLWIIGYEGYNYRYYGSPIADDELQAIAQFMESGGGVFATGDHEGMGSYICGQIPRVRSMRMWYGQEGDLPSGAPTTAVNSQGQTVSSVNWPGVSTAAIGRADTLQQNPSDSASVFQFDDQSDAIPQAFAFPGGLVHAILQGEHGPIGRFPDHMHEGEVVTPSDTSQVLTISGQPFVEYPAVGDFQPVPSIIAVGAIVGGHSTMVEGSTCEQTNFTPDPTATVARPLGVLCAYDGHGVGVGRVVTDSSFHHYLDINLIGDPCGSSPDRQQGFGLAYTPPGAGSILADLQAFYVNTAVWLAYPTPGVASINVSSNVLWAGETITGTIMLDEPAGSEGVTVELGIPDPAGVTVPASVVINAGETSATFPITASATVSGGSGVEGPGVAGGAVVYATGPDGTEKESPVVEVYAGQIVVILPAGLLLDPGLVSGETATGTIVVRTPAPASGGLITLSTSRANAVSIPASVPLPGGGTSASFTLTALPVPDPVSVTISASYEGNSSTSPLFKVIAHEPPPRPPLPPPPPGRGKPV